MDDPVGACEPDPESDGEECNIQAVVRKAGLSIPVVGVGQEQREFFKKDVLADPSLRQLRDKGEQRYFQDKGQLKHKMEDSMGEIVNRLVMPSSKQEIVLRVAHNNTGTPGV